MYFDIGHRLQITDNQWNRKHFVLCYTFDLQITHAFMAAAHHIGKCVTSHADNYKNENLD